MNKKIFYLMETPLILLSLISLAGGLVYRFYSLNTVGVIISLILAIIFYIIIILYFYFYANKKNHSCRGGAGAKNEEKTTGKKIYFYKLFALLSYVLLLAASFYILLKSRTANSIISPWQTAPKYFFLVYSLSALCLIFNIFVNKRLALILIIFHYFLSFSVAMIIYRLGYGYDSFIHQATESLIAKAGAVEPKPLYYLGQYGLIVILHKIFSFSIVWLDRLLAPLLAAIFLPLTLWRVLNSWFNDQRLNLILILAILSLGFSFLIVTTPQNLAYLLLIIIILRGLICDNFYDFSVILLLSLTALIIQPLAGLPAVLFACLLAVYHGDGKKIKPWLYALLFMAAIIILPALFYFLNLNLTPAAENNIPLPEQNSFKFNLAGENNFALNFIYLYGFNFGPVLALLALSGMIIAYKFKDQCRICFLYLAMAVSLFLSYFIIIRIPFSFLINYERGDFSERMLLIGWLFLLPFLIIALYDLIEKIVKKNLAVKISWLVFLAVLTAASLYLSYPRYDNYFNSRGFSVSDADLKAVEWINNNAASDFIVLANQQVSAAALSRFGFKKYYANNENINNQLFYYPIPTSSPLYSYYLTMVYARADRDAMFKAMNLAQVKEGYFVLNKYWRGFKKIMDEAKFSANGWQEFNNGEVLVFKYVK